MKPNIIIIGAGGHGKVVHDAIIAECKYEVIGFADSAIDIGTIVLNDKKVISNLNNLESIIPKISFFIVAIGNNEIRRKIFDSFCDIIKPATVIHTHSVIGSNVKIGLGTVVLANSIINASSCIGQNSIINSGVIIDHDCQIGNHVYLKLGAIVGNNSVIPQNYTSDFAEIINPFSHK